MDVWSIVYHTLQLFILHAPHRDPPIPWQLHVGRFLGALPICITALLAFVRIFPDQWNLMMLRLPWKHGHVVICGLGEVGFRLAIEGRRRKKRIVAIERSCPLEARHLMREQGVLILDGDAADEGQLRTAQVDRAEFVVASCVEDETDAAIAASVDKILASSAKSGNALICRTLIRNPYLQRLLSKQKFFNTSLRRYRVNFSDLDEHAVAARQALVRHPLDIRHVGQNDETVVHLS